MNQVSEKSAILIALTRARYRLGAELLQSSIGKFEVISIQITFNILHETPDIPLFVSPQKSSSPT